MNYFIGMEEVKRKIRGRKLAVIQLVLLVSAIVAIVLLANSLEENRDISEVIISGNTILAPNEILTPELKKMIDTSKGSDIIFNVSSLVKKNPFVTDAFVSFRGSDKLLVEIKERRPSAIVIDNYGAPIFICSDGFQLPYSHLSEFVNLPVFRNYFPIGKSDSNSNSIKGSIDILKCLSDPGNEFIQQNISEIIFDARTKSYDFISSGFGIRIFFGSADDACNKLRKLSIFWEREMPRITPSRVKYVDVRWNNQVVVNLT